MLRFPGHGPGLALESIDEEDFCKALQNIG